MADKSAPQIHFSDHFGVDPAALDKYGAFNISLINDLPLFIDPFLLFNSTKPSYITLHADIIDYLRFLRAKASTVKSSPALVATWYTFPEFKQTWLGFSDVGNSGHGLGHDFAYSLRKNLNTVFSSFGNEKVSRGSHLEKLTLISEGVGRDKISDFATNLIKGYLLGFTSEFAEVHIHPSLTRPFAVPKVSFNYKTESWEPRTYLLPAYNDDFVVLTPKDMLTKDDTWINKSDLLAQLDQVIDALPSEQLRAQLNNYLAKVLPEDATAPQKREAAAGALSRYPQVIEYFILFKEEHGEDARSISKERVAWSEHLYVQQARSLADSLLRFTKFYEVRGETYAEARARLEYLKDVIENKGGWRIFYVDGKPIEREKDVHILYRLTWYATPSDVSHEVDDGRGPADFKISLGSQDKTIVEFKLASNRQLRRNLERQAEIYKMASDAKDAIKAIIYFSEAERDRVNDILKDLGLLGHPDVILIDARSDNKPSASTA